QSFQDADLTWMGRAHTGADAIRAVRQAKAAGFERLTVDLIFGLPGLDEKNWKENLEAAISLDVGHLSVYALTVEDKTALAHQLEQGKVRIPAQEQYAIQFKQAHEVLTQAGYRHYELSNYARPGAEARHNSAYWNGEPYLGIGPSAHSYDGRSRIWNKSQNAAYIRAAEADELHLIQTEEKLSQADRYHEYIMTHLRQEAGIELVKLRALVPEWEHQFASEIRQWTSSGHIELTATGYRLNLEGWLISDHISSDFFL
ncbi:MAG: coproporphyrinogen III oxidase, partial [Bacteroidota bacterium]